MLSDFEDGFGGCVDVNVLKILIVTAVAKTI